MRYTQYTKKYADSQTLPVSAFYTDPIIRHYEVENHPDAVPHEDRLWEFVHSNRRIEAKVNQAFKFDGPATALNAELNDPYFFTLDGEQLNIPKKYRPARCVRNKTALAYWRAVLRQHFKGAFFFKFEVGLYADELHVHLIAEKWAGLPELVRGSKACKPVTNFRGLIEYLMKPACYPLRKRVNEFLRAKKRVGGAKLPETSGYVGLPRRAERVVSEPKPSNAVTDIKSGVFEKTVVKATRTMHATSQTASGRGKGIHAVKPSRIDRRLFPKSEFFAPASRINAERPRCLSP